VTSTVRLVKPLGQGGMAAVWLADHAGLDTRVVVKFLSSALSANEEALARFRREAAASAQVKSPHVVQVFDYGVMEGGPPFIVMEYLEGRDLAQALDAGPLPPREVVEIVTQVARALTRAHAAGIIHRDIKPENIFLCDGGDGEAFVKLLDFGIAKATNKVVDAKTQDGQVVGTPFYMSPEQILGQVVDLRADLWALGVVAFEALTGKRPFEGETVGAITLAIHSATPKITTHRPQLPAPVDAWFAKACALEPSARFRGAKELSQGLAEALGGAPSAPAVIAFRPPMPSVGDLGGPTSAPALASTSLSSTTGIAEVERRQKGRVRLVAGVVGAAVLVLVGGLVVLRLGHPSDDVASGATASTSVASAPTMPMTSASAGASATPTAGLALVAIDTAEPTQHPTAKRAPAVPRPTGPAKGKPKPKSTYDDIK
jgi:eukaryotic-like serine/threonine-protein kinase